MGSRGGWMYHFKLIFFRRLKNPEHPAILAIQIQTVCGG